MGVGILNIWVSEVADPCGTYKGGTAEGGGGITVLDCKGVLEWPCGRFRTPEGEWVPVPGGQYLNLPFECGHLDVEVPPGCYWAIADWTTPMPGYIHFNYGTHVGITEVGCDQTACVKLYNPSIRQCWDWFLLGLRMIAIHGAADPNRVEEVASIVEGELLAGAPRLPVERVLQRRFEDIVQAARRDRTATKKRKG
jgi:hypothetical protein